MVIAYHIKGEPLPESPLPLRCSSLTIQGRLVKRLVSPLHDAQLYGIAVNHHDGTIYVADRTNTYACITVFSSGSGSNDSGSGDVVKHIATDNQLVRPYGMALDSTGNRLYVCDAARHQC